MRHNTEGAIEPASVRIGLEGHLLLFQQVIFTSTQRLPQLGNTDSLSA